jgi:hypothetical protein
VDASARHVKNGIGMLGLPGNVSMASLVGTINSLIFRRLASSLTSSITGSDP